MKKEFVPYQQSLELKELGFDEPCFAQWDEMQLYPLQQGGESAYFETNKNSRLSFNTMTPLYQQAFRWFREKSFICHVTNDLSDNLHDEIYVYVMTKGYGTLIDRSEEYRTYEEAELACLRKLIEIVKNKL
jgi:hypothetical protein